LFRLPDSGKRTITQPHWQDPPGKATLPPPLQPGNVHLLQSLTLSAHPLPNFFFSADLTWDRHVKIMCNRARALLKSLQILGNSVRGLDFASWRLAYDAVCLPVLSYGLALWAPKALGKHFKQVDAVQNQAVRLISGSFRTAPLDPLHEILAIFPFKSHAHVLLLNVALRYCRLPRESQAPKLWNQPGNAGSQSQKMTSPSRSR
jgi:hypothetical protein